MTSSTAACIVAILPRHARMLLLAVVAATLHDIFSHLMHLSGLREGQEAKQRVAARMPSRWPGA